MKIVECPLKRVDWQQLVAEFQAAGIDYDRSSRFGPVLQTAGKLLVRVADETDEAAVLALVAAHVPPPEMTAAEMLLAQARSLSQKRTPDELRLMAILEEVQDAFNVIRAWNNRLVQKLVDAGLPVDMPTLPNRTWEEAQRSIDARVAAKVSEGGSRR